MANPGRFVVLVAAAILLTACGDDNTGGGEPDPGLAHVHGLGVDPADGTLYAASHHGVFRLPEDGEPERIADNRQDTMGFTVVGPRHFLGSGHPDPRESGLPPHLGLIESTDAGQTWQTRSLSGEVDFHALEAKHDRVYGFDSQTQQLMVSTDKKSWDRLARLPLADFAVHPTDPGELLATTEQGLARSTDGGRTFTVLPKAPRLLLVDWPTATNVVGADPAGTIHLSTDAGATWSRLGQVPGQPGALTNDGTTVYVATESGIHVSDDGGKTFRLRQPMT